MFGTIAKVVCEGIVFVMLSTTALCSAEPNEHLLTLTLDAQHWPKVNVMVSNRSAAALRFWEERNSWGWGNLALVAVLPNGLVLDIRRITADFTKNGTTFYSVAAGETKTIELSLTDGWWQGADEEMLRQVPIAVSVILHIDPSTEATELHVWTGTAISPWTGQAGQ